MSAARTCVTCSALLPDDAGDVNLCPACAGANTARFGFSPAAAMAANAAVPPGELQIIGDYEVLGKLGAGGMGAVYRARQRSLDRYVALKILPTECERDPDYVARFQREAKIAASFTHPNLVQVYSYGEASGCHFIAMELVDGENLHARLRRTGPLAPVEALRICTQIARGLQCGWQHAQLIHRDIKPSNIFLAGDGNAKLGDLGLAKSLNTSTTGLTHSGTMMGTPHYISPEQARADKKLDFRADIYSLGCTLYQCLTGHTPYEADDPLTLMNLHLTAPPPALLKAMPGAPVPLGRLVSKMLRKSRHERHGSYDDLIADPERVMELLVHGDQSTAARDAVAAWKELNQGPIRTADVQRVAEAVNSRRGVLLGATAAVAVVLGLGVWWMGKKSARSAGISARKVVTAEPASIATAPASAAADSALVDGVLTFAGHRYQHVNEACNWQEARAKAEAMGGHLATINSKEESEWIGRLLEGVPIPPDGRKKLWIGGHTETRDQPWRWVTDEPMSFTGWRRGEPDYLGTNGHLLDGPFALTITPNGWAELASSTRFSGGFLVEWDDAGAAAPAVASATTPAAERWRDLLADEASIEGGFRRIPEGLELPPKRRAVMVSEVRDGAIRARSVWGQGARIQVGARFEGADGYLFYLESRGTARLFRSRTNAPSTTLAAVPLKKAIEPGQEYEMELRAVGTTLTAKIDGEVVITVEDSELSTGRFRASGLDREQVPALLKSLDFLDLTTGAAAAQPGGAAVSALEPGAIPLEGGNADLWRSPDARWEERTWRLPAKARIGYAKAPSRDMILRAGMQLANSDGAQLCLRKPGPADTLYRLGYVASANRFELASSVDGKGRLLRSATLPRTYAPLEFIMLEARAIGDEISLTADGTLLFSVKDSSVPGPGNVMLHSHQGAVFRDVVYMPLDKSDNSFARAKPVRFWDSQDKIPNGTRWKDGALFLDSQGPRLPDLNVRDVALRAKVRLNPDLKEVNLSVRVNGDSRYTVSINAQGGAWLTRAPGDGGSKKGHFLGHKTLPVTPGPDEWVPIELRAVGNVISVRVDGKDFISAKDAGESPLTEPGTVMLYAQANGYFRDVEYVPLDMPGQPPAPVADGAR